MALTPTSTFSDVMRVTQFSDKSHQDKALKSSGTTVLYQKSAFNTQGEVASKQAGVIYIKASLDREFGVGFGDKVFARANTYKPGLTLDQVVKGRDLALLERASSNLRAEDTVDGLRGRLGDPARGIAGAQVSALLDVISNPKVGDGTKFKAEMILREALGSVGTISGMRAALTPGGQLLPQTKLDQLTNLTRGNGAPSFTPEQRETMRLVPLMGGNTATNRQALTAQLPPGAQVGVDGSIGGTTTINQFQGGFNGQSFSQIMNDLGQASLGKAGVTLSNGLTIGTQAERDFYRMNITVNDGVNPPYNSVTERTRIEQSSKPGEVPERTNVSVSNALLALGNGQANVVRVLSGVVNQQFSTPFVRGVTLQNGTAFNPAIASIGSDGNVPLGGNDRVSLVHPGGIGAASLNISKLPNGNYRVDVSYPFTLKRPTMEHDSKFAGCGGTTIQGLGQVSYTVDATAAAQGRLVIAGNGPATITWSGHMI